VAIKKGRSSFSPVIATHPVSLLQKQAREVASLPWEPALCCEQHLAITRQKNLKNQPRMEPGQRDRSVNLERAAGRATFRRENSRVYMSSL